MILDQPLSLSSAPTTPLTLVPNGSFLLLRRTAALSSNRTNLPSGLLTRVFVRTTTARRMSPLRTLFAARSDDPEELGPVPPAAIGRAFLMTQTISSPGVQEGVCVSVGGAW